jgi:hypothetical protein
MFEFGERRLMLEQGLWSVKVRWVALLVILWALVYYKPGMLLWASMIIVVLHPADVKRLSWRSGEVGDVCHWWQKTTVKIMLAQSYWEPPRTFWIHRQRVLICMAGAPDYWDGRPWPRTIRGPFLPLMKPSEGAKWLGERLVVLWEGRKGK